MLQMRFEVQGSSATLIGQFRQVTCIFKPYFFHLRIIKIIFAHLPQSIFMRIQSVTYMKTLGKYKAIY